MPGAGAKCGLEQNVEVPPADRLSTFGTEPIAGESPHRRLDVGVDARVGPLDLDAASVTDARSEAERANAGSAPGADEALGHDAGDLWSGVAVF